MSIRAGKLRHYVTIQQATETQDSLNAVTPSWGTFAQVWAGFETLSGREYFEAAGRQAEVSGRFWLRDTLSGVTDKMRVLMGSRTFDIKAVLPPEKPGGYLQLMTLELV